MTVRPAQLSDCEAIWRLTCELAEYEKLTHQLDGSAEALCEHLFGPKPYAEALVAEVDGLVVGYALFFSNYSTFLTKPGIWLEDLIVTPTRRGQGIGKALLMEVIKIAKQRGCGRLEWAVLDWNEPAIKFYESIGAQVMPDWRVCRMDQDKLSASEL